MIKNRFALIRGAQVTFLILILSACSSLNNTAIEQNSKPVLQYTISMPDLSTHYYHVELSCSGWTKDTIDFKMPKWMPGYYQIMDYAREVKNFSAKDSNGKIVSVKNPKENTWQIIVTRNTPFSLSYDVKADRKFVANNYLDSTHGYIVPAASFLYINEHINIPVSVKIIANKQWSKIVTGLDPVSGKTNEFNASDFDMLYDCPILIGNLEELPPFKINGIEHRFVGYKLGSFNRKEFMTNLKKIVQAGVEIIGDIPYKQYTFIGIGPGYGGIEHLNNTTVSFDGNGLDKKETMNRMMNFLAHEYFHHYNVKRIRPYELGPFDYDKENKTNLLWVSEGLTVYYEYLIVKRAGLISEKNLLTNFESSINAFENNPGRFYQSLAQASYNTWSDGPFGKQGENANKSISYYDKGPAVGLILDLTIRNATQSKKSLDDVMRLLYWQYYNKLQRGFTDAEFQQACEAVSGISLSPEFEYIYTTKELDYTTYLSYAGLKIGVQTDTKNRNRKFTISRLDNMNSSQYSILQSWLGK
jgi:predicted metalloprotease with PDZ domain